MKIKQMFFNKKISILSTILLIILMIFTVIPFYIMIVGSFKPAVSLVSIPIDLNPFSNLTLRNIITVLQKSEIFIWLKNSFMISLLGALITSFVSITAGYSFARINFRFKNFLFFLVMATLMMPKQVLLIPNFLVANQLHLVNTMLGVIITSIAPASGVFLCRQFISSIPRDLFEAAEIDGCGELRKFYLVNIPLSLPAIGTTMILSFFSIFNDYLWQLIMISGKNLKTLPIGVTLFAQTQLGNKAVQLATALIATIPLVILFLVFQKFFIKGNTEGAVKG